MNKYKEIEVNGEKYRFKIIPLEVSQENTDIKNIFYKKNNKTLGETFTQKKYSSLKEKLSEKYKDCLKSELGKFLEELKEEGNQDYRCFLNKYGDEKFCEFKIKDFLDKVGLYCFIVDDEIMYVGRCTDNFKKRFNQGYGSISPKNCFKDGQATNCHINSLVNKALGEGKTIKIGIHEMPIDKEKIEKLEKDILGSNKFEWNIQNNKKGV